MLDEDPMRPWGNQVEGDREKPWLEPAPPCHNDQNAFLPGRPRTNYEAKLGAP